MPSKRFPWGWRFLFNFKSRNDQYVLRGKTIGFSQYASKKCTDASTFRRQVVSQKTSEAQNNLLKTVVIDNKIIKYTMLYSLTANSCPTLTERSHRKIKKKKKKKGREEYKLATFMLRIGSLLGYTRELKVSARSKRFAFSYRKVKQNEPGSFSQL